MSSGCLKAKQTIVHAHNLEVIRSSNFPWWFSYLFVLSMDVPLLLGCAIACCGGLTGRWCCTQAAASQVRYLSLSCLTVKYYIQSRLTWKIALNRSISNGLTPYVSCVLCLHSDNVNVGFISWTILEQSEQLKWGILTTKSEFSTLAFFLL